MSDLRASVESKLPMTVSEMIEIAKEYDVKVTDVVLIEAAIQTGLFREEILSRVMEEYRHNLRALEIGMKDGESILLGTVASQLAAQEGSKCFTDSFLDDALLYTLAAQVGNHCIGLRPCAGTGDSCPYAGFTKAMIMHGYEEEVVAETAGLILKIGGLFRVGKVTTGCNMEGFGAGAACIAAATVSIGGGTPEQMEKAMVLALSPTIGVPCTPRVLVPALCTSHLAGAILIGMYAGKLCMKADMDVNVPFDVMLAMAAEVHMESGREIVPTVVKYMEPFFKRKPGVEELVSQEVKEKEAARTQMTNKKAAEKAKSLAKGAGNILSTLGDAVVGGSSQAVGSPTNAARICHELVEGKIKKVRVELYPELFARRSINIPGILMGAVYGASTEDYEMYDKSVQMVKDAGIEVEILEASEQSVQRITIFTDKGICSVDTLNRGGGRLVLRKAQPSIEDATKAANRLGIILVE
ncbi:L-serine dehydratase [Aequitasia blattaphilus]|uniref:Serine dehydratase n=1 Tax=Aequitasia blattaphilus TaxID=2949332 RepID=A0ABT1EBF2_9FIRM|nr:serine dehydratase [Aequitasia blattaphilus]MCP1101842.1 serine dehydratase [Aequitasia blattaphilus]MCR8614482.1 serine dehydratase [Aequitasia blattaphilus]